MPVVTSSKMTNHYWPAFVHHNLTLFKTEMIHLLDRVNPWQSYSSQSFAVDDHETMSDDPNMRISVQLFTMKEEVLSCIQEKLA